MTVNRAGINFDTRQSSLQSRGVIFPTRHGDNTGGLPGLWSRQPWEGNPGAEAVTNPTTGFNGSIRGPKNYRRDHNAN